MNENRLSIAFAVINANRFEGTSRAVLEVAERLADQGHDVDLLARTVQDADLSKLNWIPIPGIGRPEIADFATYKWRVDKRLLRSDYDIIHSAGPNTSMADVYTIQTVHPVKMRRMVEAGAHKSVGLLRRLSRRLYDKHVVAAERESYTAYSHRGPRAFLPVSAGTESELVAEYPKIHTEHENISIIPNGADLDRFTPEHREVHRVRVREEHGIGDDKFVLVFSGGDWRRKGLDVAIRSIHAVEDSDVVLLVVGHDRAGGDVKALVNELGVQDRVVFAGFRPDVHRYYAAGDLFLFPTTYEAFSLATIEAAASGLPVLMPVVSGASELVGDGSAGLMIARSPERIAESILSLKGDTSRLHDLGRSARRLVEERFNWEVIANQTYSVYQQILQQRSRPANGKVIKPAAMLTTLQE